MLGVLPQQDSMQRFIIYIIYVLTLFFFLILVMGDDVHEEENEKESVVYIAIGIGACSVGTIICTMIILFTAWRQVLFSFLI